MALMDRHPFREFRQFEPWLRRPGVGMPGVVPPDGSLVNPRCSTGNSQGDVEDGSIRLRLATTAGVRKDRPIAPAQDDRQSAITQTDAPSGSLATGEPHELLGAIK
jgi:hypothetical protein